MCVFVCVCTCILCYRDHLYVSFTATSEALMVVTDDINHGSEDDRLVSTANSCAGPDSRMKVSRNQVGPVPICINGEQSIGGLKASYIFVDGNISQKYETSNDDRSNQKDLLFNNHKSRTFLGGFEASETMTYDVKQESHSDEERSSGKDIMLNMFYL